MRALVLSPEIAAKIAAQVAWADAPENHYRPGPGVEPPGDSPAYTMMLDDGFRVVYSHTVMPDGRRYRHLSVSVRGKGNKYPATVAVWTLCTLFGFTGGRVEHEVTVGPGKDWRFNLPEDERCMVVSQPLT
jgi:hypothetical protein